MNRYLRIRVVLDRPIAALLLALLAPLLGGLALAVRLIDGRPAFVAVRRVGQDGRAFGLRKLRTMRQVPGAGHAGGSPLTASGDERITPLGKTLRRYHLDELPQLLNVARGQMSLLGPRPEAPEFVDQTSPTWASVLAAPPALAGPTQVYASVWEEHLGPGSGEDAYREWVLPAKLALDQWYVRHAGIGLDVRTVVAVVQRVLLRRGSTALDARVPHSLRDLELSAETERSALTLDR